MNDIVTTAVAYTPEEIKAAEKFFLQECVFVWGADKVSALPPEGLPEVAFIGRSNVGKSSLINALVNRNKMARASNTPGRTQQINFFNLGGRMTLVDLPGYGYAVASKVKIEAWNDFVRDYLTNRENLKLVVVLVDSRHGLKDSDRSLLSGLMQEGIPFAVVLTKTDKPKRTEVESVKADVEAELQEQTTKPEQVFAVSAENKYGIPQLRAFLASLAIEAEAEAAAEAAR